MIRKIIYGICGLLLFQSLNLFASTTQNQSINELQVRTNQMQEEIECLRAELAHLKNKRSAAPRVVIIKKVSSSCGSRPCGVAPCGPAPCGPMPCGPRPCGAAPCGPMPCGPRPCAAAPYGPAPCASDPCNGSNCPPLPNQNGPGKDPENNWNNLVTTPNPSSLYLYTMGATVTTSPFLGLRTAFDASDVIVNLPTMNEDLRFLKEHVELKKQLKCRGLELPDRPIIELSGKIEGIMYAQEDFDDGATTSDVNLGGVRLDVLAEVSPGVHGYMAFSMDNSTLNLLNNTNLDIQLAGGISRIFNSRVFISRAFLTIGDLDRFPFYFTIGQMFVPFGRYASNMVSAPLTLLMFRTNERAALLGYYRHGLYASAYIYRGDTDFGAPGVDEWGTNWGYEYKWGENSINFGAGYISNVADSTGMQATGASRGFFGFSRNFGAEILVHRVPGFDFHTEMTFGHIGLIAEYITTTREFAFEDLNFNERGAKLAAMNAEASYTFKIVDRPASVAVGYTRGWDALALGLPEESFLSAFNISIWKNTIESLEFRHDNNYPIFDIAGGRGAIPPFITSVGGNRNTYTFQIGVYF